MFNDRLTELERRLALAEHEAQTMREQLRALQQVPAPSRSRRDGIVVLLGLVLMFAAMRALDTYAQTAGPQVLTVKAPFQVLDAAGQKVLMKVEDTGKGYLVIGDSVHGGVNLGIGRTGAGYLTVRTAGGDVGADIGQFRDHGMGVYVTSPDGNTIEGSLGLDARNKGRLILGDLKSAGVDTGVGASGAGYLTIRTAGGDAGADIGQFRGRQMGMYVLGPDGLTVEGSLGLDESHKGRLLVGDPNSGAVDVRTDEKGGSVKVMKPNGVAVGGLLADEGGGRITLTGPAGVKPSIVLGADPDGGFVSVYGSDGGAMPVAALQASSGKGNVYVFNAGGQPIASLSSGNNGGTLQLTDLAGTPMVQAGTLPEHVGIVRTGPASRAPGGLMGVPGSFITGKGN